MIFLWPTLLHAHHLSLHQFRSSNYFQLLAATSSLPPSSPPSPASLDHPTPPWVHATSSSDHELSPDQEMEEDPLSAPSPTDSDSSVSSQSSASPTHTPPDSPTPTAEISGPGTPTTPDSDVDSTTGSGSGDSESGSERSDSSQSATSRGSESSGSHSSRIADGTDPSNGSESSGSVVDRSSPSPPAPPSPPSALTSSNASASSTPSFPSLPPVASPTSSPSPCSSPTVSPSPSPTSSFSSTPLSLADSERMFDQSEYVNSLWNTAQSDSPFALLPPLSYIPLDPYFQGSTRLQTQSQPPPIKSFSGDSFASTAWYNSPDSLSKAGQSPTNYSLQEGNWSSAASASVSLSGSSNSGQAADARNERTNMSLSKKL
eukprot:TRINITY_DN4314_c0_g1_i1.p1 TRINITY_DN4314_c0_g1~~TRINITY_DN4314_c0_g1_i1.p1  ORF type:complete len:374 (+),score=84.97 TRINITY_DN4314_c0_g1_i1:154-1275(+)